MVAQPGGLGSPDAGRLEGTEKDLGDRVVLSLDGDLLELRQDGNLLGVARALEGPEVDEWRHRLSTLPTVEVYRQRFSECIAQLTALSPDARASFAKVTLDDKFSTARFYGLNQLALDSYGTICRWPPEVCMEPGLKPPKMPPKCSEQ